MKHAMEGQRVTVLEAVERALAADHRRVEAEERAERAEEALERLTKPLMVLRDAPFAWEPAVYSECGSDAQGREVLAKVVQAWDEITAALAAASTPQVAQPKKYTFSYEHSSGDFGYFVQADSYEEAERLWLDKPITYDKSEFMFVRVQRGGSDGDWLWDLFRDTGVELPKLT